MSARLMQDTELINLVAIYNEARNPLDCFREPDVSLKQFKELVQGEEIYVVTLETERETQAMGFSSVWVSQKFVHHLYVHPAHQNRGVASLLVRTCIMRYGFPLGLKSLVANTHACAYYERNGWIIQETGEGVNGPYHFYVLNNSKSYDYLT